LIICGSGFSILGRSGSGSRYLMTKNSRVLAGKNS
jgi:hypothetical protein